MTSAAIMNFTPPEVMLGQQVVWYSHGRKRSQDAMIGYLVHCGGRTCTIYLCTGRRVDAVRHVTDPKLDMSPEQREQGAWDFTDEFYRTRHFKADVAKRLDNIERQLAALITKSPPASGKRKRAKGSSVGNPAAAESLRQFRELKQKAIDLGIDVSGMKKPDILKAMENVDAPQPAEMP